MELSEELRTACEDLTELEGKQIELLREKNRLNNHKQVFLAELERINLELDEINGSLDDVNQKFSTARWRRIRLRVIFLMQLLFQCLYYVGTFLAFVSINLLYVLYFILAAGASLARMLLDSQISSFSGKKQELDDSLSWT